MFRETLTFRETSRKILDIFVSAALTATWSHNPPTLFSLLALTQEKMSPHPSSRAITRLRRSPPVLFVILCPAAPRLRSPPIADRRPIAHGYVLVERPHPPPRGRGDRPRCPDVADVIGRARRPWRQRRRRQRRRQRKDDGERLHFDIGRSAAGGRGRIVPESTSGDVS